MSTAELKVELSLLELGITADVIGIGVFLSDLIDGRPGSSCNSYLNRYCIRNETVMIPTSPMSVIISIRGKQTQLVCLV